MVASGESGAEVLPVVVGGLQSSDIVKALQLDGSGNLKVVVENTIPVTVTSLPLPAGASTTLLQESGNAYLSGINGKLPAQVSGRIPVDPSGVTSPVSAESLPLPAGASTSLLQESGNASLIAINGKLNTLGQKNMAGSVPVSMASDQPPFPVMLPSGDAAPFFRILDEMGVHKAKVNADGTLAVSTATVTPANTIPVEILVESSVAGSTSVDTPYVIPNNTSLQLQAFKFGCYSSSTNESRAYLYESTGNTITAISILHTLIYIVWGTVRDPLSDLIVGNGTKCLIMRRQRVDATARNMFTMIEGYLTYNTITVDETNTATTVAATTVTRTGASWTTNQWAGKYVRVNGGPPLYIASNTATVLTITGNIANTGSTIPYKIITFNP